jgi:hypothetical protein
MEEILTKTSKLTGKTEKPWEKNGKSGVTYMLQFEDFKGATFDAEVYNSGVFGTTYDIKYKKSGVYNNIIDLIKVEKVNEVTTKVPVEKAEVSQDVWLEKDRRIVRQNSNERAIELVELMSKVDFDNLQELIKSNGSLINVIDILSMHFEERVFRK